MSNSFGRVLAMAGSACNEHFDSCHIPIFISREATRTKPTMEAAAIYARNFASPALQSVVLYFLVIVISMMAVAKPADASGTVISGSLASTGSCINIPVVNANYDAFLACVVADTGAAYAWINMVGECARCDVRTIFAVDSTGHCPVNSGCSGSYRITYTTGCPVHSQSAGNTCTCTDPYVADPAGTSCVLPACPANMSGAPCACIAGHVPNPTGAGCIQEQYILSAIQDPLPDVEPGSSASPHVEVLNALTRQPKEGAVVNIKVDVDDSSGGHDHGSTGGALRPKGILSNCKAGGVPGTVDCTTGPNGRVSFTFGAPAASGTHTFTAVCISNACSGSKTGAINVKVAGLVPIPASKFYTLTEPDGRGGDKVIGDNGNHSGNHYLTSDAVSALWRLAATYHIEDKFWQLKRARKRGQYTYTPSMLYVNDASLIWGGRFDVKGNWAAPHAMHRRGVVVDVRANSNTGAIPLASFANFQDMAASYGGADAQVHCTKRDGQDRQPPTCIGRDGSQDNNRHMHILLLGVDQ